jgi:hypothetical protein
MADGQRATAAGVKLRVEQVLRLLLDGAQFHDVCQFATENGWVLKERQVRRYMAKANDLLVLRQKDGRRKALARHSARREALYARALKAGDYRTALAVLDSLAKLQGLYPAPRETAKPDTRPVKHDPLVIVVHGDPDDPARLGDATPP